MNQYREIVSDLVRSHKLYRVVGDEIIINPEMLLDSIDNDVRMAMEEIYRSNLLPRHIVIPIQDAMFYGIPIKTFLDI